MTENKIPSVELPSLDADKLIELAKDAFYVSVGLAVLGVQQAQVRRNEIKKIVDDQVAATKAQFEDLTTSWESRVGTIDARLQTVEAKFDTVVEQLKERLPKPAGDVLAQAHELMRTARDQVRGRLAPAA
jgi:hypothetical protein